MTVREVIARKMFEDFCAIWEVFVLVPVGAGLLWLLLTYPDTAGPVLIVLLLIAWYAARLADAVKAAGVEAKKPEAEINGLEGRCAE